MARAPFWRYAPAVTLPPDPLALLLAALRGVGAGLVAGPWREAPPLSSGIDVLRRHDARGSVLAETAPILVRRAVRWTATLRIGGSSLRLRTDDGALGWISRAAAMDAVDSALGRMDWCLLDALPDDPPEREASAPALDAVVPEVWLIGEAADDFGAVLRRGLTDPDWLRAWFPARAELWLSRYRAWMDG